MIILELISEIDARNRLTSRKGFSIFKFKKNNINITRLELIHLPFYAFDLQVENEGTKQNVNLAVDGLLGHAVFFVNEDLSFTDEKNVNKCNFELPPAEAEEIILKEYKGLLLETGLRTRKLSKAAEVTGYKQIFYPFWVGYFKKRGAYDFQALDAVSGSVQGIKMRKLFLKAFRVLK
ncbi:hypothetical protein ACFL4T_03385 [candidate division KSB1 bacterium]